jgi:hypothetical protein
MKKNIANFNVVVAVGTGTIEFTERGHSTQSVRRRVEKDYPRAPVSVSYKT